MDEWRKNEINLCSSLDERRKSTFLKSKSLNATYNWHVRPTTLDFILIFFYEFQFKSIANSYNVKFARFQTHEQCSLNIRLLLLLLRFLFLISASNSTILFAYKLSACNEWIKEEQVQKIYNKTIQMDNDIRNGKTLVAYLSIELITSLLGGKNFSFLNAFFLSFSSLSTFW